MKRLAIAILLLLIVMPPIPPTPYDLPELFTRWAHAAAAFVEVQANIACSGASTCNNSITMAAGNANIVYVTWNDATTLRTISGVSDGDGAYTLGCTGTGTLFGNHSLFYRLDSTAGAKSVTATLSGTAGESFTINNTEVSGLALTSALDKCDLSTNMIAPGTGVDAIVSASVTPDSNGQFIFGGLHNLSVANSANTAGTGYTRRSGSLSVRSTEDQVQAVAAAITARYTTDRGLDTYQIGIATFREPGAAGAVVRRRRVVK